MSRLLRQTAAGVLDAAAQLVAPRPSAGSLDRELELARQHGRWLSDEERAELVAIDQRLAQRRRTLLQLLALSLLVPPLWPLVPLWLGLIWWWQTTRRLLLILAVAAAALAVLLVALVIWLLLR